MRIIKSALLLLFLCQGTPAPAMQKSCLNRISQKNLWTLCSRFGIASTIVQRILDTRRILGYFEDLRQLPLLPGISVKTAQKLGQLFYLKMPKNGRQHEPLRLQLMKIRGGGSAGAVSPLNINSASILKLSRLPGMDRSLAKKVYRYRQKHGPLQYPWQLLQVSGITPARYAHLRSSIIIGRPKKLRFRLQCRLQTTQAGQTLTSQALSLSLCNRLSLHLLVNQVFEQHGSQTASSNRISRWCVSWAGEGLIHRVTLGDFRFKPDLLLGGRLATDGHSTAHPGGGMLFKKEGNLLTASGRCQGAALQLKGKKSQYEAFISSSAFKVLEPEDPLPWIETERPAATLIANTLSLGAAASKVYLRGVFYKDDEATNGSGMLSLSCNIKKTNIHLSCSAGGLFPTVKTTPIPVVHASLQLRHETTRAGLSIFASGNGFVPLLTDGWGSAVLPGRGWQINGAVKPGKRLRLQAAWLYLHRLKEENGRSKFSFKSSLKLIRPLSLAYSLTIGERSPVAAGIWAPAASSLAIRWRPLPDTHFALRLLLSHGESATGTALQFRSRMTLSRDLTAGFWFATGSPQKGAPIHILPAMSSDWRLAGRSCFSPFHALSLNLSLQCFHSLSLKMSLYRFHDLSHKEWKLRVQGTLQL